MSINLFPIVTAIIASMSIFIFFKLILGRISNLKVSKKREILLENQLQMKNRDSKTRQKFLTQKKLIDAQAFQLGNRIARSNYGNKLSQLTDRAGNTSDDSFPSLIKQKIYFSVIGLLLSFLLISQGRWSLVFPTLLFTMLAYFIPNLFAYFERILSRSYGNKLGEMATFSGSKWLDAESIIRTKILFSLGAFFVGYLYLVVVSGSSTRIFSLFAGVIFGFFIPDIILFNKVSKRRAKFAESLPDSIDLLTMCVNAGLSFSAALVKVSEIQKGPVPEEFMRVRTEVQLGKERDDALREMANRLKIDALTNFVNSVAQVDRFGIPVSAALQQQSIELRADRKARGREKAQKVPVKILGPVMLCFLPCVLLIVLGPAIIGILGAF